MTDKRAPDGPEEPAPVRSPKRGAFPTPQSEIEKATPFVPDADEEDDTTNAKPESPAGDAGEEDA